MSIKNTAAHQRPRAVAVTLNGGDMVTGAQTLCELPGGAIITGGFVIVLTAFDQATTVDIGDAGSGSRYGNDVNLAAAAKTDLTGIGTQMSGPTKVTVTPSAINATAGKAVVVIEYVVEGNEDFSQG